MADDSSAYHRLRRSFTWQIPKYYNIGVDVCDRLAAQDANKLAVICIAENGGRQDVTFAELRDQSNQLANFLSAHAISTGDRVAILLPQGLHTVVSHIATYKLGAIALPLFTLFGVDALCHRLSDAGARVLITDPQSLAKIASVDEVLPQLEIIICVPGGSSKGNSGGADADGGFATRSSTSSASNGTASNTAVAGDHPSRDPGAPVFLWQDALGEHSPQFSAVHTKAEDPALLIYTSGTTGLPKGVLHAHRVLLGHLPGVEMSHDFLPQPGDRIWTPADWAWIGGLLDVLLPALHHGVPVVAKRFSKFTGEAAFDLLSEQGIRNAFLPPTALKIMRAVPDAGDRWQLTMRSIASGGEPLGSELLDWGRRVFGVTINEFYGQSECNMIVSSASTLMAPRPGVMGWPVAGHEVAVMANDGSLCAVGEQGDIAVRAPDPVMFLRYWNNDKATREKFRGDWLITGDVGMCESSGAIRFIGRDDDVITSSGYRIGPGEIENCLLKHPAVAMAAVIGKPDPLRTQIVKAFIVLNKAHEPTPALSGEITAFVKRMLSAHEYPREIEFVDHLPMTTSGKIIRKELRARAAKEAG